jgi:hypothetical protein
MKRKGIIILAVINIMAFTLLAIIYYFGFGFDWGDAALASTWGLPVAIISLVVLVVGILTWKKMNWKWGVAGLVAAAMVFVYAGILFNSFSYVLLPQQASHENPPTVEDNITALAIADLLDGNHTPMSKGTRYTIVNPDTEMTLDVASKFTEIKERFDKQGYDFTKLLGSLVELNQTPVRLDIDSSIEDGYYVDYDGKFIRYLEGGGIHSWLLRWQWFRPQVRGVTIVSRPAYDPETGYVLITLLHLGSHPSDFFGNIYAYKYVDNKLEYLDEGLFLIY